MIQTSYIPWQRKKGHSVDVQILKDHLPLHTRFLQLLLLDIQRKKLDIQRNKRASLADLKMNKVDIQNQLLDIL